MIARRDLLRWSALVALMGCDDEPSPNKSKPLGSVGPKASSKKAEVIVVGGGMAGLSAAKLLGSRGKKVVVLEGRERAGGRVWTDRSLGNPFDLGASWIHGVRGNPLTDLAKSHGLETHPSSYEDVRVFDHDGSEVKDSDAEALMKEWDALLEEVEEGAERRSTDTSMAAAIRSALAGEKLDPLEQRALDWISATVEVAQAEDLDKLSLLAGDDDEGFSGGDRLFPDGYDQLVKAQGQEVDVRLGHRVTRIGYDDKGVKVATDKGVFQGERVVVTLPLGVLKQGKVMFAPALDQKKRAAIARLGMGVLNKVVLTFDKTFWPIDRDFLGYMSRTKREFPVYMNCRKFSDAHALIAFTGGSFARKIEKMPAKQVLAQAFAPLAKMFKGAPAPKKHLIAKWSSDPFALGSYSVLPVGARATDFDALAEPVKDRIFFAGEATIRKHPGTVHGAMMSGVREAERILALG